MTENPALQSNLPQIGRLPAPIRMAGATLGHAALAAAAMRLIPIAGGTASSYWPAAGWTLALMLLGGRQYAWAAFTGTLLANAYVGIPPLVALGPAIAASTGLLVAHALLERDGRFDPRLLTMRQYLAFLGKGALPASALSAMMGTSWLVLFGTLPGPHFPQALVLWWMGDLLGLIIVTPLMLIWLLQPPRWENKRRLPESIAVTVVCALVGQVIFMNPWPEWTSHLPLKGYWLFPIIAWAGARLGRRSVLLMVVIASGQAMLSVYWNTGFFANTDVIRQYVDVWAYLIMLSLIGLSAAITLREARQAARDLRIAATAFECQEGMIVTDANMRILRTNQSFSRIMGYSEEEVLGKTPSFMRADRHAASYYEGAWRMAHARGVWADETWCRRRNGEVFPQWLAATAVRDANGTITNFVVTHTDISYRKQKEAEMRVRQYEQRNALVREVHHRIKNNLQGITGLLRQFGRAHPETMEAMSHVISQVRSIAVIHGLQGRSAGMTVHLCELTSAIAAETASVWQTPVRVDVPDDWIPCALSDDEAVPMALVISELITNAIKHADPRETGVDVRLRKGNRPDLLLIRISNRGCWQPAQPEGKPLRGGLDLVDAMLPHGGAGVEHASENGHVHATLTVEPPIISLSPAPERGATNDHENPSPAPAG